MSEILKAASAFFAAKLDRPQRHLDRRSMTTLSPAPCADGGSQVPTHTRLAQRVKLKNAILVVPSFSPSENARQMPAQLRSVFQT